MNKIEVCAYGLLERMLQLAGAGNSAEVLNSNEEYERLQPDLPQNLRSTYDLCRQSCVLGFTLLPLEKERLLQDARRRFAGIAVPEGYRPYRDTG